MKTVRSTEWALCMDDGLIRASPFCKAMIAAGTLVGGNIYILTVIYLLRSEDSDERKVKQ